MIIYIYIWERQQKSCCFYIRTMQAWMKETSMSSAICDNAKSSIWMTTSGSLSLSSFVPTLLLLLLFWHITTSPLVRCTRYNRRGVVVTCCGGEQLGYHHECRWWLACCGGGGGGGIRRDNNHVADRNPVTYDGRVSVRRTTTTSCTRNERMIFSFLV